MSDAQSKLRTHAARAAEYAQTGSWLIGDFFKITRWKVLPVILCGAAYIGLKFAAMGVIYLCVQALSEESPIAIPGVDVLAPKSPEFVLLSVSVGMALLMATAFFRYQVRRRGIELGRQHEEYCARRIILLASRLPDPRAEVANRIIGAGSLNQYPGYARRSGIVVRQLAQLLPTFASFVAVSAALLWMDFWLTMSLAGLALLAVLAQYPANHRVASASRMMESTRRAAGRRYRALFRRLSRDPMPLAPSDGILDQLFRSGQVRDNIDSFTARATEAEQAALVSRISSSLLLGAALILLGIDIVQGERTWAAVAVYAAAVRFALSDFVSVCSLASGVTKHHAQIANHREFVVDALPCLGDARDDAEGISWPITLRVPGLHDPGRPLVVGRGDVLAVVMPGNARALLPAMFEDAMERRAGDARVPRPALLDSDLLAPDLKLRANFGLPPDLHEAAVEQALAPFAPDGEDLSLAPSGWLDRSLDELGPVPPWLLSALHVLSVRARQRPLVAMDLSEFAPMSERWRDACLAALADGVFILIHSRPAAVGKHGERTAIVCDGSALRGWLPVTDPSCRTILAQFCAEIAPAPADDRFRQPVDDLDDDDE
ncbi:MAG: hypothetical protein ACREJ5_23680 [Geminicoccaceae bacterium]